MTHAYHATIERFLPSIARHGLLPRPNQKADRPMIFVEEDAEEAETYLEPQGALLRFPCGRTLSTKDGEYYLTETIPAGEIEVRDRNTWVRLLGHSGILELQETKPQTELGQAAWKILWDNAKNNPQAKLENGFLDDINPHEKFTKDYFQVLTLRNKAIATIISRITQWEEIVGKIKWLDAQAVQELQKEDFLYLKRAAVKPGHKRQQIGSLLYQELGRSHPEMNFLSFTSLKPEHNLASCLFHQAQGFRKICEVKKEGTPIVGEGWYKASTNL